MTEYILKQSKEELKEESRVFFEMAAKPDIEIINLDFINRLYNNKETVLDEFLENDIVNFLKYIDEDNLFDAKLSILSVLLKRKKKINKRISYIDVEMSIPCKSDFSFECTEKLKITKSCLEDEIIKIDTITRHLSTALTKDEIVAIHKEYVMGIYELEAEEDYKLLEERLYLNQEISNFYNAKDLMNKLLVIYKSEIFEKIICRGKKLTKS